MKQEIDQLLTIEYPDSRRVGLVIDNLNIHTLSSLYEAFKPAEARDLGSRLELQCSPKPGSWLNIAEIDLSGIYRQYLDRHIEELNLLNAEQLSAWMTATNYDQRQVD